MTIQIEGSNMNKNVSRQVCIVSPVFNGETYLSRFFDSIISQTYRPLLLILIDDGSTDRTPQIIKKYDEIMSENDISFLALRQENSGQASAIEKGLQKAEGGFLIWPDTDDFLFPDSIQKRVDFLDNNKQYGFVVSKGFEFNEYDLKNACNVVTPKVPANGNTCKYALSGFVYQSPAVMTRMEVFLMANLNCEIFNTRSGQNVQLLLPLALSSKCGFLNTPLYGRVLRKNSHSRSFEVDLKSKQRRTEGLFETVLRTLLICDHTKPWHYVYASLVYCEAFWRNSIQQNSFPLKELNRSRSYILAKEFSVYFKTLLR